jgi:hypothetical protein
MAKRPRSHSVRLLAYLQAVQQRRSVGDFHSPDGLASAAVAIIRFDRPYNHANFSLALLCTAHLEAHTPHAA